MATRASRASPLGPRFGNQRGPSCPLATDAGPGQRLQDEQMPPGLGQTTHAGEHRVGQDRDHHRLRAPDSVRHDTERDPGQSPGQQLAGAIRPAVWATRAGSLDPMSSLTLGTVTSVNSVRSMAANIHARQAEPNDSQRIREDGPVRASNLG
jgi:hypothetical protein